MLDFIVSVSTKSSIFGSFSTSLSCQRTRYTYSRAALWSPWAVVTFLCLYTSSRQWFKAPCKGLSHPWRVEKKHAPCWGGELLSGASTSATAALTQNLAGESLEKCVAARRCQTASSNTTPAAPETGELHQCTQLALLFCCWQLGPLQLKVASIYTSVVVIIAAAVVNNCFL